MKINRRKNYSNGVFENDEVLLNINKFTKISMMRRGWEDIEKWKHSNQKEDIETKPSPFLSTAPSTVWGDRIVTEQSTEEEKGTLNFGIYSIPNTSDSTISTNVLPLVNNNSIDVSSSVNNNSIGIYNSIENATNNESTKEAFKEASQFPRLCKLCDHVATERMEYCEHMAYHFVFNKTTYVENYSSKYVEDEETDELDGESQTKGKKKNKNFKPRHCSKCGFETTKKSVLWLHLRQHFMNDELTGYVCPWCPFASTLKHHMSFHWSSAHDDFKGFTCTQCQYTCVSKSMLTSHMKTHSDVYQYNCANCMYKTKFCNAMKKHLKDTSHEPKMVLNPDGTPNPSVTIDVYGTKRGPRRKTAVRNEDPRVMSIESMPSCSGHTFPVSVVPASSNPMSPISAALSTASTYLEPDIASMSPARMSSDRMSPARMSPIQITSTPTSSSQSNPSLSMIARYLSRTSSTENTSLYSSLYSNFLSYIDKTLSTSSDIKKYNNREMFNLMMFHIFNMALLECKDNDDEEHRRIECFKEKLKKYYLFYNEKSIEFMANANNAPLSDDPSSINEPSTSTNSTLERQPMEAQQFPEEPLDLSMAAMLRRKSQQLQESIASCSTKFTDNKRKRKATELEYSTIAKKEQNINRTKPSDSEFSTVGQLNSQRENPNLHVKENSNLNRRFICNYCQIIFGNETMHSIHMNFHDSKDPLACALCNNKSKDTISFFLHLVGTKH
ncbi:protein hunchback-like isoform X1 [Pogonomyrmex barbatus]|uniref:Protein hunchback-like isoform X1 n=2 Tax=Pogonomyrmex barbatus TaxID=144034 RepID=A0A6I9WXK7_9HYME|nr:protein hunchback-like isoform X1 [Pogonomyrmex barbatus]